jgi:hypothetical protein
MVKKQNKKLKAKDKATPAHPDAKSSPKRKASGGSSKQAPKKAHSENFSIIAKPTVAPTRPTIPWTAVAMTAIVSLLRQQQVSPPSPRSPTRSLGTIRVWPFG